jgi:AcrR family transcriptional regulator
MGRQKTITDEEVLRVARTCFRERGHTATTREIAQAAGISEAVLYQRFGSKDELFFAAMRPQGPDIELLLGPKDPPDDAHAYLRSVLVRLGEYFGEVIPLALRVMMHPALDPSKFAKAQPSPHAILQEALAERLASLAKRKQIATSSTAGTARVLVSLAHDWAIGHLHGMPAGGHQLQEAVDILWDGLRVRRNPS